ncbi:MAG: hypothetical protein JNK77_10685 [Saprospiraceae bacterium]|nr:hypothetical protein [Saprospiraceae bacterium]
MRKMAWSLALLWLWACGGPATEEQNSNQQSAVSGQQAADSSQLIVDMAIAAHGGEAYSNSLIEFDFRQFHLKVTRRGGSFAYERSFADSLGRAVKDVLTNVGFHREINGRQAALPPADSSKYANGVNAMVYFALLPYYLNDRAVQKKYLGKTTIKGEPYYKIRVSFTPEEGGKDHEDEYAYWIHCERHTMDYLAYSFLEDGGGARFRQAYNARTVNGIRFADYANFKPTSDSRDVAGFDRLFENGGMTEVSKVEMGNIKVHVLD